MIDYTGDDMDLFHFANNLDPDVREVLANNLRRQVSEALEGPIEELERKTANKLGQAFEKYIADNKDKNIVMLDAQKIPVLEKIINDAMTELVELKDIARANNKYKNLYKNFLDGIVKKLSSRYKIAVSKGGTGYFIPDGAEPACKAIDPWTFYMRDADNEGLNNLSHHGKRELIKDDPFVSKENS